MAEYLVGMEYHEPDGWALYQKGITEDCESSTGIFVDALSVEAAIAWGEKIAQALLRKVNADDMLDWKGLGYYCWIEENPGTCDWKHCLSFFQHVKAGEWPNFDAMGTPAYEQWLLANPEPWAGMK